MFLQRQIAASCVEGERESLADGTHFPYKLTDVLPKYILKLESGKVTSDYIKLDTATSYTVPLPQDYSSDTILSCCFRSTGICRVVIVSPDFGTSTFLLLGTNGLLKGNHPGLLMWQGTVTSITVNVPLTYEPALIDYFLFAVPDLNSPDSWRNGSRAIGYVVTGNT